MSHGVCDPCRLGGGVLMDRMVVSPFLAKSHGGIKMGGMEPNGSTLTVKKEHKRSFSGSLLPNCSSPLYRGFSSMSLTYCTPLEYTRSGELEEVQFKKFEELWDAKWHGDTEHPAPAAQSAESSSKNLPVESKKSLSKKASQKSMGSIRRKQGIEKFQFAEGFEDWGIPRYPEDYVDPAELYCASDVDDC